MPGNYYKYECRNNHITLLLKPTPRTPEYFQCPVCEHITQYVGDILVKGLSQVAHGTYSAYAHGCRCDPCREANTMYQRDKRAGKQYANTQGTYRDRAHQDLVNYIEQGT